MKNLISFLYRNYFFVLFILLEVFSLWLITKNNTYQKAKIINSTSDFTSGIIEFGNNFDDLFSLRRANEILAEENARYRNLEKGSFMKTDLKSFTVNDTLYTQQFIYIAAKVINNTTNRRNNYLKLNKGRIHGISKDMAVISPDGVVGQVIEVSDHFCSVMSVLNSHSRISSKLKSSNQIGTLSWNGENYRIGTLNDIPSHVQMQKGDTVVTSGFSHIFPEGKIIGTVKDFRIKEGDNFFTVDVEFSLDYNNVFYVYVIKSLLRDELLMLDRAEGRQ